MPDEPERRLAALLSADVARYSALMAADEAGTVRRLGAKRALIAACVERHRGRIVDAPGDNVLAEFASVVEAVRCALALQDELEVGEVDVPPDDRMRFRIGVHLGDVIVQEYRIYGDGVNIAARIEALAEPGGVALSGAALDQVRDRIALEIEDLGEQSLKNIPTPVRVVRVRAEGVRPEGHVVPDAPWVGSRRPIWVALAVVGVMAGFALLDDLDLGGDTAPQIRSLAVLPLENLSGDEEQEYLADGMTEALISELARADALRVISRTSAMHYKGTKLSLPEIASELDVDAVIEGSVLRVGDRVRITAQLVDARTDHHLWSERYERDLSDVLALQEEVARAISDQIRVELAASRTDRVDRPRVDPAAYEAYLRGRHVERSGTGKANRRAVEFYEQAIALDPDFAAPYAGLAEAYS